MIVTVTLTPALDKTVIIPDFAVNQVNRITEMRLDAGGKGINVSKVLQVLQTKSVATGILGGTTGRWIESQLQEAGIRVHFAHVDKDTRTNLKVIDDHLHTNTDINEPGEPVGQEVLLEVYQKILYDVKAGDRVVFAGKAPKGTSSDIFKNWILSLQQKGIRCYLDADGELLRAGVEALPEMIKPNDEELARLTGKKAETLEDIIASARELNEKGIHTVVVSLGANGAVFARSGEIYRAEGLKVQVKSTVGAGDAMMAAFCHGDATGMSFMETCRLSMAVSAAAVMQTGTQPPAREDIKALLPIVQMKRI